MEKQFEVVRDQGFGRRHSRIYDTREEAEAGMARWKRQGIESKHPDLVNAGEFFIQEVPA